jgi:hypothetical protein
MSHRRGRGAPLLAVQPPHRPRLSHPRIDEQPRLDRQYPFISIKSEPQIEESMANSHPLCRGLMSHDHGPGPWDSGPIPRDFH